MAVGMRQDDRDVTRAQPERTSLPAPDGAEAGPNGTETWHHPAANAASPAPDARTQALRAVYEAHLTGVYRYLYQRVGNQHVAEDLTSQVFLKAAHELDVARSEREIGAWLLQVARTTLVDHWRQVYAFSALSLDRLRENGWEPLAASNPQEAAHETERRIADVLERLPLRARAILTYRFLRGYSLQETATALQMSVTNVKVAQMRALKLAARLAEQAETDASSTLTSNTE